MATKNQREFKKNVEFVYSKTREKLEVPLLNEVRTSHTNVLNKGALDRDLYAQII